MKMTPTALEELTFAFTFCSKQPTRTTSPSKFDDETPNCAFLHLLRLIEEDLSFVARF